MDCFIWPGVKSSIMFDLWILRSRVTICDPSLIHLAQMHINTRHKHHWKEPTAPSDGESVAWIIQKGGPERNTIGSYGVLVSVCVRLCVCVSWMNKTGEGEVTGRTGLEGGFRRKERYKRKGGWKTKKVWRTKELDRNSEARGGSNSSHGDK